VAAAVTVAAAVAEEDATKIIDSENYDSPRFQRPWAIFIWIRSLFFIVLWDSVIYKIGIINHR